MGVFLPFLPMWLEARGIDGWGIGLIAALRPLAGILVPLAFGLVADVFRLRGVLLRFAVLGTLVAIALVGLAVSFAEPSIALLALLFGLLAIFRAPMNALADVAALEEGRTSFGRQRLWGSLGFLLTACAAGYLVDLRAPLGLPVTMGVLLLGALLVTFLLPARANVRTLPVWSAARGLFGSGDYQLFLLGVFLWLAAHSAYDLCVTLHLTALGASSAFAGLAWAIGTLAEVALFAVSAPWIERHGPVRLMLLGVAISVVRWTILATVRSPEVLLPLQVLHAGSFALVFVAALGYVKQRAEPHVLATAQASFTVAGGLGAGAGTIVWGGLYAGFGGATVFATAAGVALTSVVALGLLLAAQRRALLSPET